MVELWLKRFALASFSLLCLSLTIQSWVQPASAEWGGPTVQGEIIGGFGDFWIDRNGNMWKPEPEGWVQLSSTSPVPPSAVKFFDGDPSNAMVLITQDDQAYFFSGGGFQEGPHFPSPVPVEGSTWGKVKNAFRAGE